MPQTQWKQSHPHMRAPRCFSHLRMFNALIQETLCHRGFPRSCSHSINAAATHTSQRIVSPWLKQRNNSCDGCHTAPYGKVTCGVCVLDDSRASASCADAWVGALGVGVFFEQFDWVFGGRSRIQAGLLTGSPSLSSIKQIYSREGLRWEWIPLLWPCWLSTAILQLPMKTAGKSVLVPAKKTAPFQGSLPSLRP